MASWWQEEEFWNSFAPYFFTEERIEGTDQTCCRYPTLRDLLTFRWGFGFVMVWPPVYPIQKAMEAAGLIPGSNPVEQTPDDYMKKLGALPLMHQPGERWIYHTGSDVLGVLIARASGQGFADFIRERIFAPLGMKDTDFYVPPDKQDRFATSYLRDPATNKLNVHDDARASRWGKPPSFASGGGGLVSTADDYLAFCRMMLGKGRYRRTSILSPASIALMTIDHLTDAQKEGMEMFFGDGYGGFKAGWGFGMGVDTKRADLSTSPGRLGWVGGLGTAGSWDPQQNLTGILLTQRMLESSVSARHDPLLDPRLSSDRKLRGRTLKLTIQRLKCLRREPRRLRLLPPAVFSRRPRVRAVG